MNDSTPRVQVVHALVPHAPWRITPDHRVAPLSPSISTSNPESEEGVRDTYQTFLYQVAAADKAIASLIADLKSANRWDSTLLVLTADHGISFIPTLPQRHTDFSEPDAVNDIYRIPTFIKYPGQKAGVVSDCASTNLDVLPTILEATGTKTSWSFAGASLATSCPEGRTRRVVSATGETAVLKDGFEKAVERAAHYAAIVTNVGPIRKVAAVGASATLIGSPVSASAANTQISAWTVNQKKLLKNVSTERGARIPSLLTGVIRVNGSLDEGSEGIIAVDGVAAGVIGELSGARGLIEYTAILDYTLFSAGEHSVELFVRDASGDLTRVGAPK